MTRYIGVDLHTNSLTACFLQDGVPDRLLTLPVQGGGLERLISQLEPGDEVGVVATGNSAHFCKMVSPHVSRVVVIAAWQFEVIRRSVKKTDKHDARAIAFFLSKDMLPEARSRNEAHLELSSLIATREQLIRLRVSLINKVHGMSVRHGLKVKREVLTTKVGFERHVASHTWTAIEQVEFDVIAGQLEALRAGVKRLETEIAAFAKSLPGYENLISIKGIGPLSAATLLTHIGDIAEFKDPGKLAAYFGIVPRISQSNDSLHSGHITKRGNKIARKTLVQCCLTAKRYSPYFHEFYERVKASRGSGKAIIATSRKLLNTIFHTLKNKWIFEDFTKFQIQSCNQS
ncbi:IS110 family transposase [Asticcacaulis sp. EMRT-3]|uniref:IS110 family transposase n=1 Tax=Asticcacaulis sp. EMRT-3 TaxID=3040349 RepID=UPI0024AFABB7|nr:IS110 family transposase [Asticcacaulis sp. EMRT-3]MDI7776536.1 IS110 family transposase [Asticcacaulis sp. EMRT-3]